MKHAMTGFALLAITSCALAEETEQNSNYDSAREPLVVVPVQFTTSVKASRFRTCARSNLGRVKCWGDPNPNVLANTPGPAVFFGFGRTAKSIAMGGFGGSFHNCAVLDNDSIKCWGTNNYGQLGLGTTQSTTAPGAAVDLGAGRTAKSVVTGGQHTCAILDDNSVKCWGDNREGQVGIGSAQPGVVVPSAVNLGAGRTAKALATYLDHTCAILDNDTLKCWGQGLSGELGIGTNADLNAPGASVFLGLGRTAKAVQTGSAHTCAILDNDTMKCWGSNGSGQLGVGSNLDRNTPGPAVDVGAGLSVKGLALGGSHSCATLSNDRLKCWGGNAYGQLGLGNNTNLSAPGAFVNLGLFRTVNTAAGTFGHTCAVADDHSLRCWGENANGQLGVGTNTSTNTPVSVGITW